MGHKESNVLTDIPALPSTAERGDYPNTGFVTKPYFRDGAWRYMTENSEETLAEELRFIQGKTYQAGDQSIYAGRIYTAATAAEKLAAGGVGAPDYNNIPGAGATNSDADTGDWLTKPFRITVDTVADMVAEVQLQVGDIVQTNGYYEIGDGGATCYDVVAAATGTADGGKYIDLPTIGAQASACFNNSVSIKQYGAPMDGATDDAPFINAAAVFVNTNIANEAPTAEGGYTFSSINLGLTSPRGVITIDSTIVIPGAYADVDFSMSLLQPTATFDQSTFAMDFTYYWVGTVKNIHARRFTNYFRIANPNLGLGHITFDHVHAAGGELYLDVECRSTYVKVTNARLDRVTHPVLIRAGDLVSFDHVWHKPGVIDNANPYRGYWRIPADAFATRLKLRNIFYNPTLQTALDICIVECHDSSASIDIDGSLFGGEGGQVPLIGWHGDSASKAAGGRGARIRIKNSSMFSAGSSPTNDPGGRRAMIELYSLPNTIVFDDVDGLPEGSDTRGLVYFRDDFQTFDAALAFGANTQIWFNGQVTNRGAGGMLMDEAKNLMQFVKSHNPIYYGITEPYINNSADIANAHEVVFTSGDNQKRRCFRLQAWLANADQDDSYSEYIIKAGFAETIASITPLHEGTAIAAPRLFISGGRIYLRLNTNTTAREVSYKMEKLNVLGGY